MSQLAGAEDASRTPCDRWGPIIWAHGYCTLPKNDERNVEMCTWSLFFIWCFMKHWENIWLIILSPILDIDLSIYWFNQLLTYLFTSWFSCIYMKHMISHHVCTLNPKDELILNAWTYISHHALWWFKSSFSGLERNTAIYAVLSDLRKLWTRKWCTRLQWKRNQTDRNFETCFWFQGFSLIYSVSSIRCQPNLCTLGHQLLLNLPTSKGSADELLLLQDYFLLAVHLGNEVCRTIFNKSQSSKEWE